MLKLNLGSGNDYLPGWTNIDINGIYDIKHDLRLPLPFEDGSVSHIRAIMVLEHFNYIEAENMLMRWCLLLCHGGILEIKIPSAEKIINSYMPVKDKIYYLFGDVNYDGLNLGDAGVHKWGWVEDDLLSLLKNFNIDIIEKFYSNLCAINLNLKGIKK